LLDAFMPAYDVAERHQIRVAAPATMALAVALDLDLLNSWIVRVIGTVRELVLGGRPGDNAVALPHGLLAQLQASGWGVLAELQGQEIVLGAVTQPWEAADGNARGDDGCGGAGALPPLLGAVLGRHRAAATDLASADQIRRRAARTCPRRTVVTRRCPYMPRHG
jgi:hypothetical protein